MANTTRDYLTAHAAIWTPITAAANAAQDLQAAIQSAETGVAQQTEPVTGITEDKATVRDALEDAVLITAGAIEAFVAVTGNFALLDGVDVTLSSLNKSTEQELLDTAARVQTVATENLAALGEYGVTQGDVDDIAAKRTAFDEVRSAPAVARAERSGVTDSLSEKIREIRAILENRLDKLMLRFRATHPDFHAGYEAARVIVDRRGPSTPQPEEAVAA